MIHHYPVQWPIGWPRTSSHEAGRFKVGYEEAERALADELERLGVESAYISTDQELRMDGRPRRDRPANSVAVAVYFVRHGAQLCIPCDKFNTTKDNLRAVGLTIENIRQMERYGTGKTLEATLSGFAALPAEAGPDVGPRDWWDILQVSPEADPSVVRAAYRNLAAKYHPDNPGGSDEKFIEITKAFEASGIGR